nr:Protein FAR1-RELATED SEQUENCE 5 [Cajanus cajan]
MSPLVLFSGVNHHNQTTVFASAFVADETEETYVWLLEQFLVAMGGKTPVSVITEDNVPMRSAIRRIFPNAYHRLCAFHLLRNAKAIVKNERFTAEFKKFMFDDYEVGEFELRWDEMVQEFGVQDNSWVREMWEKRKMWATAHIRGFFFAENRTTSRCKGLRSVLVKFVDSHNDLTEFLQYYMKFLDYMRHKELEADFKSWNGEPVCITPLKKLEKSASKVFTREIYLLFRPVLMEGCSVSVVDCQETTMFSIYVVQKYLVIGKEWRVSFFPSTSELKCSCLKMESLGIPCDHIVGVMKYLHMTEMPKSLVLDRWAKNTKGSLVTLCGVCKAAGHCLRSCPAQMNKDNMALDNDDDDEDDDDYRFL